MRKILTKRNFLIFVLLLMTATVFFYCSKIIFSQKMTLNERFTAEDTELVFINKELDLAGGVAPHHLAAKEIIADFWRNIAADGKDKTIVLLSPDHFAVGKTIQSDNLITVDLEAQQIAGLEIDNELLQKFRVF